VKYPDFSSRYILRIFPRTAWRISLIIPIVIFYFGIGSAFPPNESALPLLTIKNSLTTVLASKLYVPRVMYYFKSKEIR
jgi:hypothetical protein